MKSQSAPHLKSYFTYTFINVKRFYNSLINATNAFGICLMNHVFDKSDRKRFLRTLRCLHLEIFKNDILT